jgi:hypothetical protein
VSVNFLFTDDPHATARLSTDAGRCCPIELVRGVGRCEGGANVVSAAPNAGGLAKASRAGLGTVHEELQTHKDLTLQLVWQESRENDPEGYSCFCDLFRRWLKKLDMVLRQEHRAGETGCGTRGHHPDCDARILPDGMLCFRL